MARAWLRAMRAPRPRAGRAAAASLGVGAHGGGVAGPHRLSRATWGSGLSSPEPGVSLAQVRKDEGPGTDRGLHWRSWVRAGEETGWAGQAGCPGSGWAGGRQGPGSSEHVSSVGVTRWSFCVRSQEGLRSPPELCPTHFLSLQPGAPSVLEQGPGRGPCTAWRVPKVRTLRARPHPQPCPMCPHLRRPLTAGACCGLPVHLSIRRPQHSVTSAVLLCSLPHCPHPSPLLTRSLLPPTCCPGCK